MTGLHPQESTAEKLQYAQCAAIPGRRSPMTAFFCSIFRFGRFDLSPTLSAVDMLSKLREGQLPRLLLQWARLWGGLTDKIENHWLRYCSSYSSLAYEKSRPRAGFTPQNIQISTPYPLRVLSHSRGIVSAQRKWVNYTFQFEI